MNCLFKTSILKYCIVLILILLTTVSNAAIIKGHVFDGDTHKFISNAIICISETNKIVIADVDGKYKFNNLKQGTYVITGKCMGYENSLPQKVIIESEGANITYDIYLKPSVKQLNELVINRIRNKESDMSARYDEKIAPTIMNIISAKAIEMLPDQNVADIMQRVSGVSMLKNSAGSNTSLIIRGMPPRYNNVLLNGIAIPKSVTLDMIGSELVGRVEVTKAATPDLNGDGIGGTVNVVMKQAPDTAFLIVKASTGYNQYNLNHEFLTYDSKAVTQKDLWTTKGNSYVPSISDFSRTKLIINNAKALPDMNGSIAFGNSFFNKRLGFMAAATMQNTELASTNFTYVPTSDSHGNLTPANLQNSIYCRVQKRYGGYVKLNYNFNDNNQISIYNSFFALNEIRARIVVDTSFENDRTVPGTGTVKKDFQTIIDNSGIESLVMLGKHKVLENLDIDWSLSYIVSNSSSPDYGTVNMTQDIPTADIKTPWYLNYRSGINRIWQWQIDESKIANLNISYKPTLFNHLFEVKAGGSGQIKFIKNYVNEYVFKPDMSVPNVPNPDILTIPLGFQNDQQAQGNAIDNQGNFRANEDLQSGYAMVRTTFGKFNILTGMRVEFTYLTTEHNQANTQVPVAYARYTYYDLLPSVNLNYKFTENQNLRFSMYQAINRPYPTEVIPYDDTRVGGQSGNSNLKHSTGTNYDIRYEIYPNREEVFTAGLFYKKIVNAIENLIKPGSENTSFENVPLATNYGLELVGVKYFWNLGINFNYTYTYSAIDVPKRQNILDPNSPGGWGTISKTETRPLVGQSPHLINIGLSYRNVEKGLNCNLVYTMQGSHVVNISDVYGQDTYQRDFHDLGVTIEKSINKKIFITAKVSNILNSPIYYDTKSGFFLEKLNTYQNFYIGLKYTIL